MVIVKPFNGILYNKEKIDSLCSVFCPSYDDIFDHNREIFMKDNPYNIVRILSGPSFPDDTKDNNQFTRAADHLNKWLKDGILIKDKKPCIYLYETTFRIRRGEPLTRRGFIALTKIEKSENGNIKAHELTFKEKKKKILELIKTIKANISPIFCIYKRSDKIHEIIKQKIIQDPYIEFFDRKYYIEKLWRIDELSHIKIIEEEMKHRSAYIADGHHRYEAMVDYQSVCHEENKSSKNGCHCDYMLTFYVEDTSRGLAILPAFRLLKYIEDYSAEELISRLKKYFNVEEHGMMDGKIVFMKMRSEFLKHAFGIFYKNKFLYITLKEKEMISNNLDKEKSVIWNSLDVNIINLFILEKVLGLKREDIENGVGMTYTRWIDHAIKSVETGENKIAIFLNGTKLKQMMQIADKNEKMPQKSTHFYPKLLTGIVMYDLANHKN